MKKIFLSYFLLAIPTYNLCMDADADKRATSMSQLPPDMQFQILREIGGNINIALINAIKLYGGKKRTIELLLNCPGANINFVDNTRKTALIWAVMKNNSEAIEFLLSRGADKSIMDHQHKTALDYATEQNYSDIIELLNK